MKEESLRDEIKEGRKQGAKQKELNNVWDKYVKATVIGGVLMLGSTSASLVNIVTLPVNETYKEVVSLENEINSYVNIRLNQNSNKEEIIRDITSYFSNIEEKQSRLVNLVNTLEYKNVLEAREKRSKFNNYMRKTTGAGFLLTLGGLIPIFYNSKKEYE